MSQTKQTVQLPRWVEKVGNTIGCIGPLVTRLADVETRMVERWLDDNPVRSPIFIAGLACTGATMLLEAFSRHPAVGTHQYRDFPLVQLPYWWNNLRDGLEEGRPVDDDVISDNLHLVTSASPEAMDEILWMDWFPTMHDPQTSSLLDGDTDYDEFERFYRNHIAKLLLVRGAERYVSKGNYILARLAYLLKIFPDARFVIPVRSPYTQIPSLMRQHRHLSESLTDNRKGRTRLKRVGLFETGLDRRPMNVGDDALTESIDQLWAEGEELRGWARYWAAINSFVAGQLDGDAVLGGACKVVRYEDLCNAPREVLSDVFSHAGLEAPNELIGYYAEHVHTPASCDGALSKEEMAVIREEAGPAAVRFGCYL